MPRGWLGRFYADIVFLPIYINCVPTLQGNVGDTVQLHQAVGTAKKAPKITGRGL
jgi:hypothetical protein